MTIQKNVPLARYSTFGIGGVAEFFVSAGTPEKIVEAIKISEKRKVKWNLCAGGSNIVFPDSTLKGLLIRAEGGAIKKSAKKLIVDAGVRLEEAVRESIQNGFSGLEALSGIPGSVGGAVVGNAGAYGHSISEVVSQVEIWDGKKRRWIPRSSCRFGYRESVFSTQGAERKWVVLRAELVFKPGDIRKLKKLSRAIIAERTKKYAPSIKCPGSFFKNVLVEDTPKAVLEKVSEEKIRDGKIPAGYLLESVGAKGMREGDIKIAGFHGNLLMNIGEGTAKDVKKLAGTLKKKVKEKFGIMLEEEVKYF